MTEEEESEFSRARETWTKEETLTKKTVLDVNPAEGREDSIPVERTAGAEPQTVNGVWMPADKSYSSNGVGVRRQIFKPL